MVPVLVMVDVGWGGGSSSDFDSTFPIKFEKYVHVQCPPWVFREKFPWLAITPSRASKEVGNGGMLPSFLQNIAT